MDAVFQPITDGALSQSLIFKGVINYKYFRSSHLTSSWLNSKVDYQLYDKNRSNQRKGNLLNMLTTFYNIHNIYIDSIRLSGGLFVLTSF